MPCESPAIAAHHWEPPMIPNVGPSAWRCPHPVPASIEAHGQALPDMAQTNANSSTSRFIVLLSWYHNVTFQVAGDALHRTDTSSSSWFQSPNLGSRNTSEQQAASSSRMGHGWHGEFNLDVWLGLGGPLLLNSESEPTACVLLPPQRRSLTAVNKCTQA
ncbi:hypothetical protein CSPX01_04690 [Colletotrichum filicis]|nr:hypothetical protein CSPX01_04690 [Colletotrichum filicis]